MAGILELAAKAKTGGGSALPLASAAGKYGSTIPELAAKSGMGTQKSTLFTANTGEKSGEIQTGKQNVGGFAGGVGYLGEKIGVSFLQSIEGIVDYTVGGLADLFGADDWAKELMENDWIDYSHPEKWYNPSKGWQIAGDIFGGIGTSLPSLAAAALTGGTALAPIAGAMAAGLAAGGRSTAEAYRRTGELGGKEWLYGTLSGVTEGATEGISGALGAGISGLGKRIGASLGRNAAKEAAKTATVGGVLKSLGKSFAGEAFEEGFSEIMNPVWQRMTIDKNAENATFGEVAYAAVIGGLSGVLMDSAATTVRHAASISRGNATVNRGEAGSVLDISRSLSDFESRNNTGDEGFRYISDTYRTLEDSMKKTDGKITTVPQKKMLGDLARANVSAEVKRFVVRSAENIVNNADNIANNLEKFGYKTVDGKEIKYTADELRRDVDPKRPDTIFSALKTNEALRTLAVYDATNRLIIDSDKAAKAAVMGEALFAKTDLNRFIETASDAEIRAVEEALGTDDLRTVDADTLRQRMMIFTQNGGVEAARQKRELIKEAEAVGSESARPLPESVNTGDGETIRYTDGNTNIAVSRRGDVYRIYDYDTKALTKELSADDVNGFLREYAENKNAYIKQKNEYTQKSAEQAAAWTKARASADAYLRENIAGYVKSGAPVQAQLRKIIRDAAANGISDADALSYARVSSRSGIDIVFSKDLSMAPDGTASDGYYDPKNNRIVINPETKRAHGALLIHELTHAIYYTDGMLTAAEGIEKMPAKRKQAIIKKYTEAGITDSVALADEINAHHAEETLRSHSILEKLCAEKPTLKEKILAFFKGAKADYSEDANLTKAAKRLYAQYKKLFDGFAARNAESNAMDLSMPYAGRTIADGNADRRYAIKYPSFGDKEIMKNISDIADMNAVSVIDAIKLKKTGKRPSDIFNEYFNSIGNNIYSEIFGDIALSTSSVKSEIRHGITAEKIASIEAIPDVIRHGKTIFFSQKRGSDVDRIVIAAPIKIGTADYYMGVMIQRDTQSQRLYLHNVATVKKEATSLSQDISLTNWSDESDSRLFITSILQNAINVKLGKEKIKESNSTNNSTEATVRSNMLSDNSIHENTEKVNTSKESDAGKRYSIQDGKLIVDTDQHIFDGVSREDYGRVARRYMRQHFRGKEISGAEFAKRSEHEYTHSGYTQSSYGKSDGIYEAKMKAATELDKMVSVGTFIGHEDAKHQHVYSKGGYDRYGIEFNLGGEDFSGEMLIAISEEGRHIFYDIVNIKRDDRTFAEELSAPMTAASDNSIHENTEKVNTSKEKSDGKRYALQEEKPKSKSKGRSIGQINKTRANNIFEQVYSWKDAKNAAGNISDLNFLSKKEQEKITHTIWETLNGYSDEKGRRGAARRIAKNLTTKLLSEARETISGSPEAAQRLTQMKYGLHGILFSEADAAEITAAQGKESWEGICGRWKYRKNTGKSGIPMDVFVTAISREMQGMEHLEAMHPADAFIEINRIYEQARHDAENQQQNPYRNADAEEIRSMILNIENSIMDAYKTYGKKTAFAKVMEERLENAKSTAEKLREDNAAIKKRVPTEGLLAEDARKLKDIKIGTFGNATQYHSDDLRDILGMAARINYRGNFNATGARKVVSGLREWYSRSEVQKGILGYRGESETGMYSADIAGMLEDLSNTSDGDAFTNEELQNLHKVYRHFIHITENYGKIYRRGRMVEALPIAKEKVKIIEDNRATKGNLFTWFIKNAYGVAFMKPIEIARAFDGYEAGGFFTEMTEDFREAGEQSSITEMRMMREYDDFAKKHGKYLKTLQNERKTYGTDKVTGNPISMPKSRLIALYMTYKRQQAQAGLVYSGYKFRDTDGKYISSVPLADGNIKMSKAEIQSMAEAQANKIKKLLSPEDMEYIGVLERAFEAAGALKAARDIQRMGYTNLTGGYYFPIIRANTATNIDSIEAELDRVSNASFNKDTVKGAKQALFIDDADAIFRRHTRAVCQYYAMSPVIVAYNMLYNLDVSGNPNAPKSVATEAENTWSGGNKYMKKLLSDMQGVSRGADIGNKAVNFLRGGYAKFQLGLNPKTWAKQLTSLAASTSILDWDCVAKGFVSGISKDVDTYCPLAALRNYESTAAMAQAVLDTKGKRLKNGMDRFSDALMAPIGKIDRLVVERLFAACQMQVKKNSDGRLAIGTEANKAEAGKLLAQVIRDTQQNSLATEKSAAMRSSNEIVRAFTMFTADGVAVMSKMLGAFGEYHTLKAKLKVTTDADIRAQLGERLDTVAVTVRKSSMALIATAFFGAMVDRLFRRLFNKMKDTPEEELQTVIGDTAMNIIGGLPVIKDLVSKAFDGYDIKNYSYSAMNDMVGSLTDLAETTKDWLANKDNAQARNKAIKNFAYSIGQIFGIPTRNTYNLVYGLTKRAAPMAAYAWDANFYKKNYGADFAAALEKGDTDTASFILSLMSENEAGSELDTRVRDEFLALADSKNKVLPKSVPDQITADGTEYKFTRSEKEAIREEYATVNDTLKRLVSNERYRLMDEDARAYALKYVYNAHLEKAYSKVLYDGARDAEMIAADLIGTDTMAIAKAIKKSVSGDGTGSASGSKRRNIMAQIRSLRISNEEKLLIIVMLGYTIQDGDIGGMDATKAKKRLLSFILSQKSITASEKAALCTECGFEVKNGRVITKNL